MNQYEAYKVNTLVNQYRANPDMFNDDQLDELEKLAEQHEINFKRNTSPFSLRRALQQASAGFIEGFTTLDLIPKEPRNTGEAIFRQLGHLVGFAPSIAKAPIFGIGKAIASFTGKEVNKVLGGKITKSVLNGIDFIGDKSIPMIAQRKTIGLFEKGLQKSGADALEYMKRGATARAIADEAVGLAGASAVSSVWKGTDAIMDSFIGGAIAGGAFGGIGNFANVARFHKGSPEQIERANKILRTGLGSLTTGLPATLRNEPTEMQLYEYLLGGFFGYNTRPAREQTAHKWIMEDKRFQDRNGGAEILDPLRSASFKKLNKDAQNYILYDHPMPKASEFYPNSKGYGGTTGQALGFLEKHYGGMNMQREAMDRGFTTEQQQRIWYGQKAGSIYENIKIEYNQKNPPKEAIKSDDIMDFNDPVELQESKVTEIAKAIYPSVNKVFTTENHLAKRLVEHKQSSWSMNRPQIENFMGKVQKTINRPLKDKESEALRKWYLQDSMPINEGFFMNIKDTYENGKRVFTDATIGKSKGKSINDDGVVVGEKYYELPISRMAGTEFKFLTHTLRNGKANKILTSYPDYKDNQVKFFMDPLQEGAIVRELYNNDMYIYSGVKDKNVLLIAPLKTRINGIEITKEMIWDSMSNSLLDQGISPAQVRAKLEQAFTISERKSAMTPQMHERIYISNILHHGKINGLIGDTGNIGGLHKILRAGYATSPSDFNKRMQLLGNRNTPLDPASFADIRPDGNLRVMYVQDKDVLRHMTKGDWRTIESMSDGGILYAPEIVSRTLKSVGLPDAGHFKPVSVGQGEAGVFATKSNGQVATPAWQKFMKDYNVDAVIFGSSFKVRGEHQFSPVEYQNGQYSTAQPNVHRIPIKDMQVNLGTYENVAKAFKNNEVPIQLWNQMDYQQKGFVEEFYKLSEKSQAGTEDGIGAVEASTVKGKVSAEKLANQMAIGNIDVKELPLEFVLKHLLSAEGNPKVGALLLNKIHRLDKQGKLEVDTFEADTDAGYTSYREKMDRISEGNKNNYFSRLTMHKDHHLQMLKKFIISKYANPMIESGGKAWLKAITPDQISMMTVDPKWKTKQIKEGHIYLDNAHKEMPVVLGNKRYTLGEVWDFHTRAKPKPKELTYKALSDALELVVIRTPSDSPSGTRVLRLGGFTNQNGAGAFTHYKDDYYLGGADKDSDSVKIFQGFSKKLRDAVKKNANAKDRLRPETKEFNQEYSNRVEKEFEGVADPVEKFYMTGKSMPDGMLPADGIIPKALMFSPFYRLDIAKRAKAGLDGLGNGLSAKVYLQNIIDYVAQKNEKTGGWEYGMEPVTVETPYGNMTIRVREGKVKGVDRMQFFRDLGSAIVNKSADASSDPTVKNYSHFRDMLFKNILDVKLKDKKIDNYKDFVRLADSSKDLKPIGRAIHIAKTNNSFRVMDKDWIGIQIADKNIVEFRTKRYKNLKGYIINKDTYKALNGHLGERIIIDGQEPKGMIRIPKNLKETKDKKSYYFNAVFKPNRPEFVDLETDVAYIGRESLARGWDKGNNYGLRTGVALAERMNFGKQGNYANRLSDIHTQLTKEYLDAYKVEDVSKELRKIIEKNTSVLLKDIEIANNSALRSALLSNRNFGLDFLGKSVGQFSTIEQLNNQYKRLEKYLEKSKSETSLMSLTDWAYQNSNKVKREGLKQTNSKEKAEAIENLINQHVDLIKEKAYKHNLNPDPFIKYYHTMLMSPVTGRKNKRGYNELHYSPEIHGSKLIPMETRKEWFRNYELFANKLLKEREMVSRKFETAEGIKEIPVKRLEDTLTAELPSTKTEKILEPVSKQLEPQFKKLDFNRKKEGVDALEMLALTKQDAKQIKQFTKFVNEHPVARENFNEFFTWFTSSFGNQIPRNQSSMTLKDIYAINEFFKRSGDPSDIAFTLKFFHWDPRYVDEHLVAKNIGKKFFDYTFTNPTTGEKVDVYKIMSPVGAIGNYAKNVKDRGIDIDTVKLKKSNKALLEYINTLKDKDATTRELVDWREGGRVAPLSAEAQKMHTLATDYFIKLGNQYIYAKNAKGERYTNDNGDWKLDTNFKEFYKDTKGSLNRYMRWNKDGSFDFERFYRKVVDINLDRAPIDTIRNTVGVDGLKRYLYELRAFDKIGKKNYNKRILEHRKKNPFLGVGFIDPVEYIPHMNFNKTEMARAEFAKSVDRASKAKYQEVYDQLKGKVSEGKARELAKQAQKRYLQHMENVGNFSAEMFTMKDIADLGEINESVLDKTLSDLGLKTRIGPLEARTANLKGYDKSHAIFNDYIDKVVRGYYSTMAGIHGDRQIRKMKEQLKSREVPQKEKEHFEKLYKIDRRKTRRTDDPTKDTVIPMEKRRYKNYNDVWADYVKLHLQTVLGHQTYFPERIIREVNRGIDPLHLKDKRNLFYLMSDQNMVNLYEKMWQSNRFTSVPFVKNIMSRAPLDANARKEYFSRKIHDFGRMEAQYELMTLLANTGTYATNIFSGNMMTGASAGIRNFLNVFSKKKVYDRLLTENGAPVIKTLDGKFVRNRKELSKWMEEQGIIDNFIQHEFEYNEGLKLNLKKAGTSLKNFQRDITRAMKDKKGKREESVGEVVSRYGVKDIMLKYGSFFMRHSEKVNRVNSYMAHALQAMEKFGPQGRELSIRDPFIHEMAMKGVENTQFLYQNSFRPMFMRTAVGKVLTRFKLFAWNSIRTRREFYRQAKLYGFKEGSDEYNRAKDLFLTDMFMMALGGAFMFSIFDTSLAPPYDWIQALADWTYGDKKERDMAFFGSPLGPANLLKPPIARVPEAMGQILSGDWETFSNYTAYTLFPFGRLARQGVQLTDDRIGRGLERSPEILVRFPYNQIQSRIERAKRRSEQSEVIEEMLG